MTLTQLIQRTRFFIDEPVQQNWLDSDLIISINRAQENVAKEIMQVQEDYFEKIADLNPSGTPPGTIAGQELYALPSDFKSFKRVERSDTGEMLRRLDLNEKGVLLGGPSNLYYPAGPLGFYVAGNSIGFAPIPQSAVPIRMTYVYQLTDLANGTDVSDIPSDYHDLLALGAAIDAFIKDESDTTALERKFNGLMAQLVRTIRSRVIQEPRHVQRVSDQYGGDLDWRLF